MIVMSEMLFLLFDILPFELSYIAICSFVQWKIYYMQHEMCFFCLILSWSLHGRFTKKMNCSIHPANNTSTICVRVCVIHRATMALIRTKKQKDLIFTDTVYNKSPLSHAF